MNTTITQNQAVLTFLRSNRRKKMSTRDITEKVNARFKTTFTTVQISKCLNKFCKNNVILSQRPKNQSYNLWYSK